MIWLAAWFVAACILAPLLGRAIKIGRGRDC